MAMLVNRKMNVLIIEKQAGFLSNSELNRISWLNLRVLAPKRVFSIVFSGFMILPGFTLLDNEWLHQSNS